MYSDTEQFGGNGTRGFFPKSKWLPSDGAQFGTVIQGMGDASTPGWPNTDKIEGPPVPYAWRGSLNFQGVGRGPGILNFSYVVKQTMSSIRNVFALIRGSEEPDRFVILGNHWDAWTYGAVDPNSGPGYVAGATPQPNDLLIQVTKQAFEGIKHRYKMRMDVYSLIMVWGLECGEDTGTMRWVMEALVPNEYLGEMESFLEWVVPREGFDIDEVVEHEGKGIKAVKIPFVRWSWGQCMFHHRIEA
ncbi:hypothetical protein SUGI_0431090 [Cryptomeria japonica]|nr:hypothetical protein SUGI_0431090 [Cryptomeria japonica]